MYGHPDLFSHLFQQRLERAQCCAQVSAKPADRALRLLMSARSGKLDLAFEDKERERERKRIRSLSSYTDTESTHNEVTLEQDEPMLSMPYGGGKKSNTFSLLKRHRKHKCLFT